MDEANTYKDYVRAKETKGLKVGDVAKKHRIKRYTMYGIVRRIERGNVARVAVCTEQSRLRCLWQHKYQPLFISIPKNRKAKSVQELTKLFRQMKNDGFSVSKISLLTQKDRSTILHHLEK